MTDETLIVKSKVGELIRSQKMMMASASYSSLSKTVSDDIATAINRAKENGRKTVRPSDFTHYAK